MEIEKDCPEHNVHEPTTYERAHMSVQELAEVELKSEERKFLSNYENRE
jgi:hypothetical protein